MSTPKKNQGEERGKLQKFFAIGTLPRLGAEQALSHYSELSDIQRCIVYTQQINPDFLVTFFGTMTPENAIECLKTLMTHNIGANKQVIVQIATKYNEQTTDC